MYNHFRNDVLMNLTGFDSEQLSKIVVAMDKAAARYTFAAQVTDLAVVGRKEMLDLVKLYTVVNRSEGQSQTTIKMKNIVLNKFVLDCNVPIKSLTANHIRSWLYNYQINNDITSRSLDLYRVIVCSFLKWCSVEGYIPTDITLNVKRIKFQKKQRKALTQLQLEQVRHACKDARQSCIVQVLYSTGCRVTELIGIKVADIDWAKRQISVLGKGNKMRIVYLNAKAQFAIKTYINTRKADSEYLIAGDRGRKNVSKETVQRVFRDLAQRTGIEQHDLTPHIMRHTMATQAATVCPIQQVQRMLGHASINTTMIYAETNDDAVRSGHELAVI